MKQITESALRARVKEAVSSKALSTAEAERLVSSIKRMEEFRFGSDTRKHEQEKVRAAMDRVFGLEPTCMGWADGTYAATAIIRDELQKQLGHSDVPSPPAKAAAQTAPAMAKTSAKPAKAVAEKQPVTDLVKGIVDKVMKTPTAPSAPAAPARDPKILELERAVAAKDAELKAELAKADPKASAAIIDEWVADKGGCRTQFAGDFKAFAAYRRNVG